MRAVQRMNCRDKREDPAFWGKSQERDGDETGKCNEVKDNNSERKLCIYEQNLKVTTFHVGNKELRRVMESMTNKESNP